MTMMTFLANAVVAASKIAPAAPSPGQLAPAEAAAHDIELQLLTYWRMVRDWIQLHAADVLLAAILGSLIYTGFRWLRRRARKSALKLEDKSGIMFVLLKALARTTQAFMIIASIRLVIGYTNPPAILARTVSIAFIVAATIQGAMWLRTITLAYLRRRAALPENESLGSAMSLINVLVSVAIFIIAGIVVLDNVGVNVTGLIAGLGIGGIAIGLAAKGVFEDLFAALAIIFDRPFRKGETIRYGQTTATVERIGLKSTRLRAVSGEEVIISNTQLLNQELSNFAQLTRRRMSLNFGVAYYTPVEMLDKIPDLVKGVVCIENADIVRCGIIQFGPSTIDYELQFDIHSDDFAIVFATRHRIAVRLLRMFAENGIDLPYPTTTNLTAGPDGRPVAPYALPGDAKGAAL